MVYLKVIEPIIQKAEKSWIKKVITFLVGLIIPKANPDFDKYFDHVAVWLIEFLDENSIPEREIGLNRAGGVIMKMPYKKNYGYWTDNNLTLHDF